MNRTKKKKVSKSINHSLSYTRTHTHSHRSYSHYRCCYCSTNPPLFFAPTPSTDQWLCSQVAEQLKVCPRASTSTVSNTQSNVMSIIIWISDIPPTTHPSAFLGTSTKTKTVVKHTQSVKAAQRDYKEEQQKETPPEQDGTFSFTLLQSEWLVWKFYFSR